MLKITLNTLFLLVVWVLISGHFTSLPLIPGILGILLTAFLFYRMENKVNSHIKYELKFFGFIVYMLFLFKEIIKSNIHVAICILKNQSSVETLEVEANFKTEQAKILLANSITATPGTMSVNIKETSLVVHCLTKETADGVRSLDFNKKIAKLEKQ